MKQLEHILELWRQAEEAQEAAVLATVVKTRGSSYRLPGARLMLTASGRRAGSISGGCLEQELLKKAWWLSETGPTIRRYDTTPDGEIGSGGFGLGCNGIIHVLIERVAPRDRVLETIRSVWRERTAAAIAQIIEPADHVGKRLILDGAGQAEHNLPDAGLSAQLESEAREALAAGLSRAVQLNGDIEAFIEVLTPPMRLLIFGAGDDAVPLAEMAKYLGWQVSVFDGRAHYARREKFPSADEVIAHPAGELGRGKIDKWTAAVLMSHSYQQDLDNLQQLAAYSLPYLGILGPRKRTTQLVEDAGVDSSKLSSTFHSPVGLDIGADGPEQVALAILAEIQAAVNGRQGGLLRERNAPIHAREEEETESFRPRSIACA